MKLNTLQRLLLKELRRICMDRNFIAAIADVRSKAQILEEVTNDLVILGILPFPLTSFIHSYGIINVLANKELIGLE